MTALTVAPAAWSYPPAPDLRDGACVGRGDVMFPAPSDQAGVRMAIAVCAVCPLHTRSACRAYALAWPGTLAGVWAGLSEASLDLAKRTANRRAYRHG